jgi:G3E family GTPase
MVDMEPMEVLIVTGPLGSGKTTVVNRLLRAGLGSGRKVAVLINEFGDTSVDGDLVAAERPEVAGIENLVNGCACCSLRADVVRILADWAGAPPATRADRVVLETTGLADPTDLVDLEGEPELADRIRLAGCLTVLSALTPLHHLAQRTLVRHQAALASLVYVSKADLDPSLALAWESQLRAARQSRPVVQTRMGLPPDGSPDPWAPELRAGGPSEPAAPAAGEAAGPAEPGVGFAGARAISLVLDHPLDPEALEALLLGPCRGELLRAKGICAFKDWPARHDGSDRWAFQLADGRLEVTPLPAGPGGLAPMSAVVIGLDLDASAWRRDLRALERPPAGARRRVTLERPPSRSADDKV